MPEQPVTLAEVLASLSLATDLGLGLPQEHVLRQTVLGGRLADLAGMGAEQRTAVFYASLLAWTGCIADSHEVAQLVGDDRSFRADSVEVDLAGPAMMAYVLGRLGSGSSPWARLTVIGRFLAGGHRTLGHSFITHCESTGRIAERLGLGEHVGPALAQSFERWDGRGVPAGLAGAAIAPVIRVVQIADDAEALQRAHGTAAAVRTLRERRGTAFDPELVDLAVEHAEELFAGLDEIDTWETVIDAVPGLAKPLAGEELTEVLRVLADYADLNAPCWLGHSRAVGDLAGRAAARLQLPPEDVRRVERAGLVHRLGALGVAASTWAKPGPLTESERERVRSVPYLTQRLLARQPALASVGALAATVRERLDGSGYPLGLRAAALDRPARVLAAAQAYQAVREDRPHRPGRSTEEARRVVLAETHAGRLDAQAVNAVLEAAGQRAPRRTTATAGLTPREVEVLRRLVRGRSNRQIAEELGVSARTVGTHVEHIYAKAGVSSRGAAAVFALTNGLVEAVV